MPTSRRRLLSAAVALATLHACGGRRQGDAPLRLGHFPNITHAAAILGVESGVFTGALAPLALEVMTFNAGPAAIEALLSGGLDVAYLGPNPTINGFIRSGGAALRVIAGATSGGAALVVAPSIRSAEDLRGRPVATPQLGGTQDVALRSWLLGQGIHTDPHGGGDVRVLPQENAQTLEALRSGTIAGAWVPEPWASRLVL
ncbi:MAG: ABC transporter substrate-binding protein, partial [Nannocystaceae bacterium]